MSKTLERSTHAVTGAGIPTIGCIPIVIVCSPDDPMPGETILITVEVNKAPTVNTAVTLTTSPSSAFSSLPALTVVAGYRFASGTGTISSTFTGTSASLTASTPDGSTSVGIAIVQPVKAGDV